MLYKEEHAAMQCWDIWGVYFDSTNGYQTYVLAPPDWTSSAVLEALAQREEALDNAVTAEFLRNDAQAHRILHQIIDGQLFVLAGAEPPLTGDPPAIV